MKMRGLNDPLLVTSDGAPGIIKAIEVCFPRAARQRCLAHRMRNLAAKVPEDIWPDFKARVQAAYQTHDCARTRSRHHRRLRPGAGTWSCLLHGRLRSLHCAPAVPGDTPPGDPNHEFVRNPVQRGHRFQRKADSIPVIADSR
jgi:hypothetical protein